MRVRRALVTVAVGSLLVGLAGCGSDEPATPTSSDPTSEETSASTSGAGVQKVSTDAFVEQTVPVGGSAEDTVTVGVQSLVVEGDIMTLTLVYTPRFGSIDEDYDLSLYDVLSPDSATRPKLLDRTNLKEYSIISDGGDHWATETIGFDAPNGEPVVYWAVYAAPQDDIDVMDIRISQAWPEFTGVPIAR